MHTLLLCQRQTPMFILITIINYNHTYCSTGLSGTVRSSWLCSCEASCSLMTSSREHGTTCGFPHGLTREAAMSVRSDSFGNGWITTVTDSRFLTMLAVRYQMLLFKLSRDRYWREPISELEKFLYLYISVPLDVSTEICNNCRYF